MRLLPEMIRDKVQRENARLIASPDALRKWLIDKAKQLTRNTYSNAAKKGMHMLEDDPDGNEDLDEELLAMGDVPDGQLMAYVRKFY